MGVAGCVAGRPNDLEAFLGRTPMGAEIDALRRQVREATLAGSPRIHEPQFLRISAGDVAFVFDHYDKLFFGDSIRPALSNGVLTFRLSKRATSNAGSLRFWRARDTAAGSRLPDRYELSVSTTLLFESFRDPERPIVISGHECLDRLDALQRIVEHEMVHLVELLQWRETACARPRFQAIAHRTFGHTQHKHALVTPRDRAAERGFTVGARVAFDFEGVRHQGILNRITKRATVLVPHAEGRLMSDGNRYHQFYVPLERLLAG